jgi:hypothetical protein
MPYVCVFADCPTPNRLYNSRREWYQHIRNRHSYGSNPDTKIDCPLRCEAEISTIDPERHIGRHLEELALFALPPAIPDEDAESDESIRSSKVAKVSDDDLSDSSIEEEENSGNDGTGNPQSTDSPQEHERRHAAYGYHELERKGDREHTDHNYYGSEFDDPPPPGPEHYYQPQPPFPPPPLHPPPIQRHHFREPSPEIIEIHPRPRLPVMVEQSPSPPPLVREHRRNNRPAGQRARTPSPRRNDPARQVNRERDLRRQAQAEQRHAEMERARRQQWEAQAIRADEDRVRAEEQTRRAEMAAENMRVQLQRERVEAEREREREREETQRMSRLQRQIEEGRAQIDALRRGDRPEIGLERRAEMERERREAERREAERREAERREIIEQNLRDAQRRLDIERERREAERRAEMLPPPRRRDPPRVTQERVESMTERAERAERVTAEAREAARRRQEAALLGIDRPLAQGRGGGEPERRVSGRRQGRGGREHH